MANTTQNFPRYGDVPYIGQARLTGANAARDGSGSLSTLVTAGANGTRIDRIVWASAQASAAASSPMVARVFVTDNTGANPRLRAESAIPTVTASATALGATTTITFPGGLIIPSGCLIKVAQSVSAGVQDQMDVHAEGESF